MSGVVGEEALKLVQTAWKIVTRSNGFDRAFQQVSIISAGQGSCVAEFQVEEGMTNRGGILHGGCIATLIDCISTLGLMTSKSQTPGVSVNLNVNYLKGTREGQWIIVDSKTVKSGKTLAFLETELKLKETGDVIATSSHVKYIGG